MKISILLLVICIFNWETSHALPNQLKLTAFSVIIGNDKGETVKTAIDNFFNNTACLPSTPKNIQKSLEKALKKSSKSATPPEVYSVVDDVKDTKYIGTEYQSFKGVLHAFKFDKNAEKYQYLEGADTYNTLNPFMLINKNMPNFIYGLDCSGYVSSLAKAGVGLSAAELQLASQVAYDKKESYLLSRIRAASVIKLVMDPINTLAESTASPEFISGTLFHVLDLLVKNDKTSITTPEFFDVLAYEKNGGKSLQGQFDLNASGGGTYGIASVSGSLDSSATISQTLTFNSPKVAIISVGDEKTYQIEEVKETLKNAIESTRLSQHQVDNTIQVKSNLFQKLCRLGNWSASIIDVGESKELGKKQIDATYNLALKECQFSINISDLAEKFSKTDLVKMAISPKSQAFSIYNESPPTLVVNLN